MKYTRLTIVLVGLVLTAGCGSSSNLRAGAPTESVAAPPVLLNVDEITAAIEAEYPTHLRDDGISGTVRLRLFVDDEGMPADIRLLESSGHREMDSAALSVAVFLRFIPATNDNGDPLSVWVAYPIRFQAR